MISAKKNTITIDYDVPEDILAEKGLLGCVLLGAFTEAKELGISEDWFADPRNRSVWIACESVVRAGGSIDQFTVSRQVMSEALYIDDLIRESSTASNLSYYAEQAYAVYVRRQVFMKHYKALTAAQEEEDPEKLLQGLQDALWETTKGMTTEKDQKEAQRGFMDVLESAKDGGVPDLSIKSGIYGLDDKLGGFLPGAVYIISGRPGGGKSAFSMFLAIQAAKQGKKVAIWSLEMLYNSIAERAVAIMSGEDVRHYLKTGMGDKNKLAKATKDFFELPIHIEDTPAITVDQLRSQARRFVQDKGVDMLVIDYLTLIRSGGRYENRVNEIGAITRTIKVMALECQVPVILLAQMNREIEKREKQIPRMSDLRDSGTAEQDADSVAFLMKNTSDEEPDDGIVNLWIRKNRNGVQEAKVSLEYTRWNSRFKGVEEGPILVNSIK